MEARELLDRIEREMAAFHGPAPSVDHESCLLEILEIMRELTKLMEQK